MLIINNILFQVSKHQNKVINNLMFVLIMLLRDLYAL
jgi:hypothetical protein